MSALTGPRGVRRTLLHAVRVGLLTLLAGFATSSLAYASDPTIAAVGDMACGLHESGYNGGAGTATRCRQRYVSNLLVNPLPTALLDLGDNQYLNGELANYDAVYNSTFGRDNPVVYPIPGNAEYDTPHAAGYFAYFEQAGVFARIMESGGDTSHLQSDGYYSFNIGNWHLIALNSNCAFVGGGGCAAGSTQDQWLKRDLAAHPNMCTIAYWHHPRWNSGSLGNSSITAPFWTDLYRAHADIVLNGHGNHHYERDVQMSPAGAADSKGIREFIVSTGGESHGNPPATPGNPGRVQVADYTSFGVLRLTLHPYSYSWQFVPAAGGSFTDSGTASCHATPPTPPSTPTLPTPPSAPTPAPAPSSATAPSSSPAPSTGSVSAPVSAGRSPVASPGVGDVVSGGVTSGASAHTLRLQVSHPLGSARLLSRRGFTVLVRGATRGTLNLAVWVGRHRVLMMRVLISRAGTRRLRLRLRGIHPRTQIRIVVRQGSAFTTITALAT